MQFVLAFTLLLAGLIVPPCASAQHATHEGQTSLQASATRINGGLSIDGRLDEAVWQEAAVTVSELWQREPTEGAPSTQKTRVWVLYDDQALYVGARMLDSAPDSIVARLGRRDSEVETDYFAFFIDPYLDRRTGFYFAVTAAGTLLDGVLLNDDWDDDTWDGVWQGRAAIDAEGWTAELRIPYSQLRFHRKDDYVWGINVKRFIARRNEHAFLAFTPRDGSGFVSRFVDMVGVSDISPRRQAEIIPYLTTRAEYTHPAKEDPFRDGSRYVPGMGADVRIGLTSNVTLNATVNPDFGQVEVDPAVVNLSDFETFYEEKRPFFVDGASIFRFGDGGSSSNWGFNWQHPNFFYTRRVGRVPQGRVPLADYVDRPNTTRILGAAKLTGRLGGSWNVGTIHAVTAKESARYVANGVHDRRMVEAPAYYGIVRAQKEIANGRHSVGLLATATSRSFDGSPLADEMNAGSYVVGLDGWTFLDEGRVWVVNGWAGFSHVHGTRERMLALQRSPLHYFQRPDAQPARLDTAATSLTGWAARMTFNKQKGKVLLNGAFGMISPRFNVNDAGFQARSDIINAHLGGGYRWTKPGRYFRNVLLLGAVFRNMDFEGNVTGSGLWSLLELRFLNYYGLELNAAYTPEAINNRLTRGGPVTIDPRGYELYASLSSDRRKSWVFSVSGSAYLSESASDFYYDAQLLWKPAATLDVSIGPGIELADERAQWVGNFPDPLATHTFGTRYVFANMNQVTTSANIRLNWTFTPSLSLQLFAQPLFSAGDFTQFKELARPRSFDFNVYGVGESSIDPVTLRADPDAAGPAAPFSIAEPSFNFRSLRGNAVLRWEYRPGSVVYFVWTQLRSQSDEDGRFRLRRSFDELWGAKPENVFMIKLTYWIG